MSGDALVSESDVLEAIYAAIREFNGQLPPDGRLACTTDTVLMGDGGVLDSLGLINFLVLLEDALADRLGRRVPLLDERYMTADDGPFRTVGSLALHAAAQAAA